jgi:Rieske Fe-S protein
LLKSAVVVAVAHLISARGGARAGEGEGDPRKARARPGDVLAYPTWVHDEGQTVSMADVERDQPPLVVYPQDPRTGVVRDRMRLNQILLVRFGPDETSMPTRALAVDGILAYSGRCTHTGCSVSEWNVQAGHFVCPCHSSEFDPRNGAAVVNGPAPRPLPGLPLRAGGDHLVIDGPFTGHVGPKRI